MPEIPYHERHRHYRFSGELSPLPLVLSTLILLLLATFLAWVYAWGQVQMDRFFGKAILPFLLAAALAALIVFSMRAARVRNPWIVAFVGSVVSAWTYYLHWAFWASLPVWVDKNPTTGPLDLLLDPAWLRTLIVSAYEHGTWSFSRFGHVGEPVSGLPLGLLWSAELVTILGLSLFLSHRWFIDRPYCESCDLWYDTEDDALRVWHGDERAVVAVFRDRDLGRLGALQVVERGHADAWYQCDIDRCPGCGAVVLDVVHVERQSSLKKSKRPLIRNLLLSPTAAHALRKLGGRAV